LSSADMELTIRRERGCTRVLVRRSLTTLLPALRVQVHVVHCQSLQGYYAWGGQ